MPYKTRAYEAGTKLGTLIGWALALTATVLALSILIGLIVGTWHWILGG